MRNFKIIGFVLIASLMLAACQGLPGPKTTEPPAATTAPTYVVVTNTPAALPSATALSPTAAVPTAAASTPTSAATASSGTLPLTTASNYLDDRSTATALVLSYVNAINRHEYLRAYSYWVNPNPYLGSLDAFSNSFTNVASEDVAIGQVVSEGAAGSVYLTVPTAIIDNLNGGGVNKYAVCFIARFPQPGNYGAPPITPMNIDQFTKTAADATASNAIIVGNACSSADTSGLPGSAPAVENLSDLSAANYIDNRSGALEVVSSLLNAINRKEYVRAYSYWENPATTVGSYNSYAAGYADTGSVTATFGTVTSDAGAGQFHYQIPLAMFVTTTTNTQQTFVGCYTLHLANPGIQGTLPFQPLAISAGHFTKVANGTDVTPLLASACH